MIPHKLIISGFKRFKSASILLDRSVISIVGANEAGKSSLLEAILSLEDSEAYEKHEITKGLELDDNHSVVRMEYILEKEEQALVQEYGGKGNARYYCRWKNLDGSLIHSIIGKVVRSPTSRLNLTRVLEKFGSLKGLERLRLRSFEEVEDDEHEEARNLDYFVKSSLESLKVVTDSIPEETIEKLEAIKEILQDVTRNLNKTEQKHAELLVDEIENVLKKELSLHPERRLLKHFEDSRPNAILFGEDERYLKGSYQIDELENPTPALSNLFSLADLNLDSLLDAMREDDRSDMLLLMTSANAKLKKEYNDSWSQSDVFPQLHIDKGSVNLQIFSSGNFTEITRRSDGLKQYISLKAFLTKSESQSPLLLIDEAEIHLHYAAQSDLVQEFEKQNLVNSIIYTTHSAGCLPSDLGSGIRAVQAIEENGYDTGISELKNSIWHNKAGFSPILFAMGANVIAFTLARKAVITEGTSETILAPRLFKESISVKGLDFQIAPGIASISEKNAREFEFEAAKVAYLVDGDNGGERNKSKLVSGGISSSKIVNLGQGCTIEDYVDPKHLLNAVNRELEKGGHDLLTLDLKKTPNSNRIGWIEKHSIKQGLSFPSKVRIAENIVSVDSLVSIIDKSKKKELKKILESLVDILK